jgi:hypothetical protein
VWGLRALALGLVAMVWLVQGASAQGTTLYVDQDGRGGACSDGRAGEAANPATPLCSITRGLAVAPAGGRLVVRGATYPALSVSGTRSAFVTVSAQLGETVSLPSVNVRPGASYVRFEGLTLTGGETFRVDEGAHHVQLVGSSLSGGGSEKVDLEAGAGDVLIEGNRITGGGNGITFNSESSRPNVPNSGTNDPPIRNVVIRNNAFDDIGTDIIRPANFDTLLIEGNDLTGIAEDGDHSDILQSVWGGDHLIFRNNYVHDYDGQGFFLKDGRVTDVTVENNVFVNNRGTYTVNVYDTIGFRLLNNTIWDNELGLRVRDVQSFSMFNNIIERIDEGSSAKYAQTTQDHNLIGGGQWTLRGPHDIGGQPGFVNPGARDYRLAASSPAIDAGTSNGTPPRDKACRPRYDVPSVANRGTGAAPYYDIGALEHGPTSTPADTGAPWGTGCAGSVPPGSGGGRAGGGAGAGSCACGSGARGRRPGVSVKRARLHGKRLVLRLRVRGLCSVKVSGRAAWRQGGRRQHKRFAGAGRTVRRSPATITLRKRLPPRIRRAVKQGRRVRLGLRVRAATCGGGPYVVKRRAALRD